MGEEVRHPLSCRKARGPGRRRRARRCNRQRQHGPNGSPQQWAKPHTSYALGKFPRCPKYGQRQKERGSTETGEAPEPSAAFEGGGVELRPRSGQGGRRRNLSRSECHLARGPREEEEGRVASVTMRIWQSNHDLYSRLILMAAMHPAQMPKGHTFRRAGQKKPRSRGERGPGTRGQASCKEGTSSAPKGRRKDAQCPAER